MPSESQQDYWRHWYEIKTDDTALLRQGDIFRELVVPRLPKDLPAIPPPPAEAPEFDWDATLGDWIVLSASCDIEDRLEHGYAVLARVLKVEAATFNVKSQKDVEQKSEVIRRGYDPLRFLLPACHEIEPPFSLSLVYFRTQALVPLNYLRAHSATPRLRLRPPFREKFGVWVGAGFSRVGIEDATNIPPFVGSLHAPQILKAIDE